MREGLKFQTPTSEMSSLDARLDMANGEQTIRGTPFEAITRVLTETCGEEVAKQAWAESGLKDLSFNMLRKYSLRDFLSYEKAAAKKMAPKVGGFEEAIFRLGAGAVDVFFDSVAGRTMKILAGKEPHRLLAAVPNGYSVLVNFGARGYEKTGERSGTFSFEHELLGPLHSGGIFDAALRSVYHIEAKFALDYKSLTEFKFRISW